MSIRLFAAHRGAPIAAVLATLLPFGAAQAQSDTQTYELVKDRTAQVCPGHSAERTNPGVRAPRVDALRVLLKNDVTLCPDARLNEDAQVVWYGQRRVLAWNPANKAAVATMADKANTMARKEEFPTDTLVWKVDGSELKGAVVPMFEFRRAPANAPRIEIQSR